MAYKRIIEAVAEKANAFIQVSQAPSDIQEKVKFVSQRYEKLVDASQKGLATLETLNDAFQQFNELQKAFKEYQKVQWDKLNNYNDCSGNKAALQSRLAKLVGIQDGLNEADLKLGVLDEHVVKNAKILSPRSRETMDRDLNNLRYTCNLEKNVYS